MMVLSLMRAPFLGKIDARSNGVLPPDCADLDGYPERQVWDMRTRFPGHG
jgi:hypothetical protein